MTIFKLRRGTAATAAANNPVLAAGEPGYETDTHKLKVGDGTTAWSSLPTAGGAVSSVDGQSGDVDLSDTYAEIGRTKAMVARADGARLAERSRVMTTGVPTIQFGANGSWSLLPSNSHDWVTPAIGSDGRTITLTDGHATSLGSTQIWARRARMKTYVNNSTFIGPIQGSLTTPQTNAPGPYSLAFTYYGSHLSLYMRNGTGGARVRVKIDGQFAPISVGSATIVASTGVFTTTKIHGLSVNEAVVLGTITTTTGVAAGTTYYVKTAPSTTTFTLSATSGGAALTLTSDGSTASVAYADGGLTSTAVPTSWAGLLDIVFPSAAARVVELETIGADVGQISTGPTDSLGLPPRDDDLVVYSMGDSFWYGSNADSWIRSMAETIRDRTGLVDVIHDAVGGTGWKREQGTGGNNYVQRVTAYAADVSDADLVLVLGSVNDSIYTAAQVQAQVEALCAQVSPKPVAAVVFAASNLGLAAVLAGVQAGITTSSNGVAVLDLTTVLTGTGYGGATTGVGNSDVFRSSDGTHPTQAGHDFYGRAIAHWLAGTVFPAIAA